MKNATLKLFVLNLFLFSTQILKCYITSIGYFELISVFIIDLFHGQHDNILEFGTNVNKFNIACVAKRLYCYFMFHKYLRVPKMYFLFLSQSKQSQCSGLVQHKFWLQYFRAMLYIVNGVIGSRSSPILQCFH